MLARLKIHRKRNQRDLYAFFQNPLQTITFYTYYMHF